MIKHDSRGDTIIEVLIALAIIGLVLGAAYSVASRNLRITQQAQERSEALKVGEGQLEKIKSLAASASFFTAADNGGKSFCINDLTLMPLADDISVILLEDDQLDKYGVCVDTELERYHYAITYNTSTHLFTIVVRWERLGGGKDQVRMVYRLRPLAFMRWLPDSLNITLKPVKYKRTGSI